MSQGFWYEMYETQTAKVHGFAGQLGAYQANLEMAIGYLKGERMQCYTKEEIVTMLEQRLIELKDDFTRTNNSKFKQVHQEVVHSNI